MKRGGQHFALESLFRLLTRSPWNRGIARTAPGNPEYNRQKYNASSNRFQALIENSGGAAAFRRVDYAEILSVDLDTTCPGPSRS